MKIEKICTVCPAGCRLAIDPETMTVTGNRCPRGQKYGIQELTDPRRTVTAAAFIAGGRIPCVPVKSDQPVPMAMIPALLEAVYQLRLRAPVAAGDVLIADFEGSGIGVVATRSVPDSGGDGGDCS